MADIERRSGPAIVAVGLGAIAFAVVSGLTKTSGGQTTADWIGIVTLVAGAIVVLTGLFIAWRDGVFTGRTSH
jgi:hypothetical protein